MWKHIKTHKRVYMFILSIIFLFISSINLWFLPGFAAFMTAFMIILDWLLPPEIAYSNPPKRVNHEHNKWNGDNSEKKDEETDDKNEVDILASLVEGDNNEDV